MPKHRARSIPKEGERFIRKFKGIEYTMRVVKSEWGVGYKVGKTIFKTPSAAAKSITNHEINGWVFWGIGSK